MARDISQCCASTFCGSQESLDTFAIGRLDLVEIRWNIDDASEMVVSVQHRHSGEELACPRHARKEHVVGDVDIRSKGSDPDIVRTGYRSAVNATDTEFDVALGDLRAWTCKNL